MKSWLGGKPRGLFSFLLICGLVAGGLGWATTAALRLEQQQHEASVKAEHEARLRQLQEQRELVLHALQHERNKDHADRLARFADDLRLALWRLDGRIAPALAREDTRPYNHYRAVFAPPVTLDYVGNRLAPASVLEPSPLLNAELPDWMTLHFQTSPEGKWGSPQVLVATFIDQLSQNAIQYGNVTDERRERLQELALSNSGLALLDQARRQEVVLAAVPELELPPENFTQNPAQYRNPDNKKQQKDTARNDKVAQGRSKDVNPNYSPFGQQQQDVFQDRRGQGAYDYQSRAGVRFNTTREGLPSAYDDNAWSVMQNFAGGGSFPWALPKKSKGARDHVLVRLGTMTPMWLPGKDGKDRLVVTRRVRISSRCVEQLTVLAGWPRGGLPVNMALLSLAQGDKKLPLAQEICQGILLDWDKLQKLLAESVRDLFPEAKFAPLRNAERPPHPERTMTALPVEMDPGPEPPPPPPPTVNDLAEELRHNPPPPEASELGWTPLRVGLGLAWLAALVALGAVCLGGWSLIDLSERRIRFVSAVTHELRTPLTTLRLYLDMLTGGMVQDEQRKEEYLHTLSAETERLNRLVSNVLDFSRLEKQHPQLIKASIQVGDLVEQIHATWQTRCHDMEKVLVVEDSCAAETAVLTDVQLVQQILGNLIDNACKYSRGAEDPHIWLRAAVAEGRLVLEVEDRGPGVAKREQRSIFQAFNRGKSADVTAGGVGLGLALAQRWTKLLGGKLTLCNDSQRVGACFRLELPLTA